MPSIHETYEAKLLRLQRAAAKRIKKTYESSIQQITATLSSVNYKGQKFALKDYPLLNKKVEKVVAEMHSSVYAVNVNSIKESWDIANEKNNILADKRLVGKKLSRKAKGIIYDPNKGALDQFIARKEKGLGLSDRIWNNLDPFKKELEQSIGLGLGAGKPARDIAKDIKKYLNEPDKLFRKVRGEDGKLHLSAAARDYHPGQGVYRSSYKNALRVSRTETNMSYRRSDGERWKNMPFVTGFEVRLSNSHPRYDICDKLVGEYPKDFDFVGWHPQCLCFKVPKLMNDKEFEKIEDQVLAGQPVDAISAGTVTDTPKNFKDFVKENKDQIAGWKNQPYWVRDNPQAFKDALEGKTAEVVKEVVSTLAPGISRISTQFSKISSEIKDPVAEAMKAIDQVHGDGILDDIPIEPLTTFNTSNGHYARVNNSKAEAIRIRRNGANPELTTVHEMGHYLDHYSIRANREDLASAVKGSPTNKIANLAKKTEAIKIIETTKKEGFLIRDNRYPADRASKKYMKYLLDPKEIWARAYTQYIAEKSGSTILKAQLEKIVQDDLAKGFYMKQWTTADFKPIREAIDKMFKELGWLNQ